MTITAKVYDQSATFLGDALISRDGFRWDAPEFRVLALTNLTTGHVTRFELRGPGFDDSGKILNAPLATTSFSDGRTPLVNLDWPKPDVQLFDFLDAADAYLFGDPALLREILSGRVRIDGYSASSGIRMDAGLWLDAPGRVVVDGSRHDDVIVGTRGDDVLDPGQGADVVLGSLGNDRITFGDIEEALEAGSSSLLLDYSLLSGLADGTGIDVKIDFLSGEGRVLKPEGTDQLLEIGSEVAWYEPDVAIIGTADADRFEISGAVGTQVDLLPGGGDDEIVLRSTVEDEFVRLAFEWDGRGPAWTGIVANFSTGVVARDGFGGRDRIDIDFDGPDFFLEFVGTDHDDRVIGTPRGENLVMRGGDDTIDGAGGVDAVFYEGPGATSGVTVDLAAGTATGRWDGEAFTDALSRVEVVIGTRFRDDLTGNEAANVLIGGDGPDALRGGAGDDTLRGGEGADFLDGGPGADELEGGGGYDTFVIDHPGDRIVDEWRVGESDRLFTYVDVDLRDAPIFSEVHLRGDDDIRVDVGDPNRPLHVFGNSGNNVIVSHEGSDTLEGGGGKDVFAFVASDPTGARILDFGAGDRLALDDRFFGLGDGSIDVRAVTKEQISAAFRSGKASYDEATGELRNAWTFIVKVEGAPDLGVQDILLF